MSEIKHTKGPWKYDDFSYIHADPRGWFPTAQAERLAKEVVVVPRRLLQQLEALDNKSDLIHELVRYLKGEVVGEVRGWGHLTSKRGRTPDEAVAEQDANGRLMAAAPEMYEALKEVQRQIQNVRIAVNSLRKSEPVEGDIFEQINAALTKAEEG